MSIPDSWVVRESARNAGGQIPVGTNFFDIIITTLCYKPQYKLIIVFTIYIF